MKYKSKFERDIADHYRLDDCYEVDNLEYIQPETKRRYVPDFKLADKVYLETKGKFTSDDRRKHLWLREQCPDILIIILFQNANQTIHKKSKTSYGEWCDNHNIIWYCWRTKHPPNTVKELIEDASQSNYQNRRRGIQIRRNPKSRRTRLPH